MENLKKLMYWRGIGESYYNYKGDHITVSWENRIGLLKAMGVDTDDAEAVEKEAYSLDIAPWKSWLNNFVVAYEGEQIILPMNVSPNMLDDEFQFEVRCENGEIIRGSFQPSQFDEAGDYLYEGLRYSRRLIKIPAIPLGYHRIELTNKGENLCSTLAIAPNKAYVPGRIKNTDELKPKPWGIIVQLYTLRSESNWGIGDFSDLNFLIEMSAELGADAIGLNPLHALKHPIKHNFSPYSPSDRRFLNPLYIDPEQEAEFEHIKQDFQQVKAKLREPENVNYSAVAELKFAVFKQLFEIFKRKASREQKSSLAEFKQSQGEALTDYCLFQVMDEQEQLESLQNIDDYSQLLSEHKDEVDFQIYLQWLAEKQLEQCQQLCKEKGMAIGLIRDLAVGANGGGAEVQMSNGLFVAEAAVGAPPDPMAELGQNWGLPPIDPATLRQTEFKHFINLLRDNMLACGALRIDHAMSLFRLWWCPPGKTADFGAYVYYPFHEMLGLLKLESVRNRCLIVGEDMGVVPPELRQALIDGQILTNKLFYFEKNHDGTFKDPAQYDIQAMSMLTNHDVPTLASWWNTTDLKLRDDLNQLEEGVTLEQMLEQRSLEKRRLLEWLVEQELVGSNEVEGLCQQLMSKSFAQKVMTASSRCASQLFVVQLEDLELMDAPVNVPGTSDEYANWQRKLSRNLEDLFADEFVIESLKLVAQERAALEEK